MKDYETLNKIWQSEASRSDTHACFCVGPQNGEDKCPCAMRRKRSKSNLDWLKGFEAGRKSASMAAE
jgi:hypothetical protein